MSEEAPDDVVGGHAVGENCEVAIDDVTENTPATQNVVEPEKEKNSHIRESKMDKAFDNKDVFDDEDDGQSNFLQNIFVDVRRQTTESFASSPLGKICR